MSEYKSTSHCKYLCQYHIIFCPKFRYSVLNGNIETSLKEILIGVANRYEYEIIQIEVMPDHIHIFVGAKPTVDPMDIVRIFKSITAIELFKKYPKLKSFYGKIWKLNIWKYLALALNIPFFHVVFIDVHNCEFMIK